MKAEGITFVLRDFLNQIKDENNGQIIDKKCIMIDGLKKDKLRLEQLRDNIKRYYDEEFVSSFTLFPPKPRRQYNRHQHGILFESNNDNQNSA